MRLGWFIALALMGCQTLVDDDDLCGAQDAERTLIGKPVEDAVFKPDATLRIIRPGDAVSQDYRIERLNLMVDGAGIIQSARCG